MFGISEAVAAGLKVLDKFIPDPEARAKAEAELRADLMSWDAGQSGTNTVEAAHKSLFVAGWRPAIGWVCALAFMWHFMGQPLTLFFAALFGRAIEVPQFPMETLLTVLMGMLGLGGLRTYEKLNGIAREK